MRIISAMTDGTEALMAGTPEQQMQAQRERQAAEHAHAIISTRELRRTDLEFGPRFIEHLGKKPAEPLACVTSLRTADAPVRRAGVTQSDTSAPTSSSTCLTDARRSIAVVRDGPKQSAMECSRADG